MGPDADGLPRAVAAVRRATDGSRRRRPATARRPPPPPSSGNAGLAAGGGAPGWRWAALIAAIGATAAAAACARRGAGAADALTSAGGAVANAHEWAQGLALFHVPAIPDVEFTGALPFAESNEAIRNEIATAANPFGGFGRILVRHASASAPASWRCRAAASITATGLRAERTSSNSDTTPSRSRASRRPRRHPGPGELVYAYTQPEALLNEVQHLLSHGLPPERAGEPGPGDPDRPGDFEVLYGAFGAAIGLTETALAAETLDAFRDAVRALIAVDEQLLLEEAGVHAELLAGVHGPRVDLEVEMMERHTANAETRTLRVRGQARAALEADSLEAGKAALAGAASDLRSGRASVRVAASWAQSLMAFHAPSPPSGEDAAADGEDAAADGEDAAADGEDAAADGEDAAPPPPSSGNAGLAAGGGAPGWRWAALIAVIGATAAAAVCARRGAGRRRAS